MSKLGRPTKYKKEFCEMVITFMEQGYSLTAFAGQIGAHRSQVYRWCDKHPAFRDAVKLGQAKCQLFHERLLMAGICGKIQGFNVTGQIFSMKCRFPDEWKEKQELHVTNEQAESESQKRIIEKIDKLTVEEKISRLREVNRSIEEKSPEQLYMENKDKEPDSFL